jgi:hypothetical protein
VKDGRGTEDTTSTTLTATPPDALLDVAAGDPERAVVIFHKPVERASAETAANYAIDQGAQVLSASLGPAATSVRLQTSRLRPDTPYTVTVSFGLGDGHQWQGAGCVALKANQWQHVAIVCDGEKTLLYVDGIK